jgi:hypothetical protein
VRVSAGMPVRTAGPCCQALFRPHTRLCVTEHGRDKPWLVVGSAHRTVELEDSQDFP